MVSQNKSKSIQYRKTVGKIRTSHSPTEPRHHRICSKNISEPLFISDDGSERSTNDGKYIAIDLQQIWSNMLTPTIIEDHILSLTNYKLTTNPQGTKSKPKQQYHDMTSIVTVLNLDAKQSS